MMTSNCPGPGLPGDGTPPRGASEHRAGGAGGTVAVAARFHGPPRSGNGGYVCGLVGSRIAGPAEVTLFAPPPLERPLTVVADGRAVSLLDRGTAIARGLPTTLPVAPPVRVPLASAERAADGYAGFSSHPFPTCFVCGPQRRADDGLHLFPGPVDGTPVVAAPWVPAADLADSAGGVVPEVVWAALDCPSYFGARIGAVALLGRLAADLLAPVRVGRPHVVLGWGLGREGRKHLAGAAVTTAAGDVLAVSRATWVEPRDPAAHT